MRDASQDTKLSVFGRRNFLRTAGVAAGSLALGGTASAYHENYDTVVDIVDEGADNSGGESINPVLDDLREDSILIEFPEGEYKMDRQFRHTDFDDFGIAGDDATIVPVQAGDWNGAGRRLFKLGTAAHPGDRLRFESMTFDYTAPNTGLRAIQAQVYNPYIRWITVKGRHDTGNWGPGPMLVDVVDPDGSGRVERVNLRDGGEMDPDDGTVSLGPIGFNISNDHSGTLEVYRCRVKRFPSNGLYCSADEGRTIVKKGQYADNNIANIRLAGQNSEIRGAHVTVWHNPDGWESQLGVRLDEGGSYKISGLRMWSPNPTGNGIRIMDGAKSARIEDSRIIMGERKEDAIFVDDNTGPVEIVDTGIRKYGPGQHVQIQGPGGKVYMRNVWIQGGAPGGDGGSHAIRVEREGCEFRWLHVDQPGDDYRRALTIQADDTLVVGGKFHSTHHPIVVDADSFSLRGIEAKAYNDSEGIKLNGGDNGKIVKSTVYNGIENNGADFRTWDNEYPDS